MKKNDLYPFLAIVFLLTWGIAGLYIFGSEMMVGLFGELTGSHPLFYLAVWAPAIAAISVVLLRHGFDGLRPFFSRLLMWRASLLWYALILLIMPLVFYVAAIFKGGEYELFPFESLAAYLAALFLMGIKGPLEELGWRGIALPLLQRRMAPIWASIVLGLIWALWHTPAFLLSGTVYSAWAFVPFVVGTVAISVVITPLFNRTGGSILLPALLHWQLINPLWPDVQPYDNWIMVGIAVIVVWFNRKTMFTREGAITEVLGK
ncbi:MAG: CPBP family intramembrane metalloprotease [Gammaproteobacteria bacterium]|nr:CPBP family intramembrane metalloprotease [Gammaproteobacteria bacterium]